MRRRTLLSTLAALPAWSSLRATVGDRLAFQFALLNWGDSWNLRQRALVRLCFEIQKRCNIPIQREAQALAVEDFLKSPSPFVFLSGNGPLPSLDARQARDIRIGLQAGGLLVFDSFSADDSFQKSAYAFMERVFPEIPPQRIPPDHTVFQSYYLLKEARGRLNRSPFLEGWTQGRRTYAFYSPNDLLGALETDQVGNWSHNMEIGGGFRRELCFRLAINLTYYALTLNYKKDRAFPPVIERRRRQ